MSRRKKAAIEMSLTDFVDFVCKAGSSKLTKVRQIKNRDAYSPATDFYKALREGIIENHRNGKDEKLLNGILEEITDVKKIKNYTDAINGYKKFWGRKDISFFKPPFKNWSIGEVNVRVNPELGLEYGDNFHIIKLYLKSDKVSKDKIDQILTLMESQLRGDLDIAVRMAVLDVKNAKLFVKTNEDVSLLPLLDGEAKSFETIWKSI